MDAYAYIRFSTPRQEKGDSLRRQTDDVTAFCARQGWPIVETIQDLGQSAWTGAHLKDGNLGKFAERVRRGDIQLPAVLVVERLDRLSRQEARITQRWMEDMTELGLAVASVDGGRVYTDASLRADLMGTFEILMRAQLAHQESEQKSQRVLDSIGARMEKAKKTGQKITAKAPGWLVLNEDRQGFTVIEERAAIVRDVYEMAAAGKGARWIAKTLNERGVPAWGPPRKDGKPRTWEISSIKLMLAQPAVEGDYVPGFSNTSKSKRTQFKEPILGYYERIVDADLVARARAAVQGRKTGPRKAPTGPGSGGRYTTNVANLFAGQVFCGHCRNKMRLKLNSQSRRYLYCNHASRAGDCDQKALFNYDALERGVLDQILHLALDDRHFSRPDETGQLSVALAEVDKAIADGKAASRRLVRLAAQMDEEDPEVVDELKQNRKAISELEARREEVAAQLAVARGAVSPDEHLARVRDLRGALYDDDAATRQAARLRVQTAMKGLGVRLMCDVKPGDVRSTLLMLKTGYMARIANDGAMVGAVDMPGLMSRGLEDLGPGEEAQAVAERLGDVTELMSALKTGLVNEAWGAREPGTGAVEAIATHLRRQREEQNN